MIGLDTNVMVRYLVQDDPQQAAAATELVEGLTESDPGFLSIVTVVELHWVLRRAYRLDAVSCAALMSGILDARELTVEDEAAVRLALAAVPELDFADALVVELGRAAGCDHTVTFDRRATRAGAMPLLATRH